MIKGNIAGCLVESMSEISGGYSIHMIMHSLMDVKEIQKVVAGPGTVYITKQNETIKPWHYIQDIYVNEEKKTVVVKFKDGAVVKKTACEGDTFDTYAGVALCLVSYLCGSTKEFHNCVNRRTKKSGK